MNTKTKFGIREGLQQGGVYCLTLLLQGLDLPCDHHPPLERLIGVEICQMGEWVWAFRWQGLQ